MTSEDAERSLAVDMCMGVDLLPGGTEPIAMWMSLAPTRLWEMPATRVRGPKESSNSPSFALMTLNAARISPLFAFMVLIYPFAGDVRRRDFRCTGVHSSKFFG